MSLYAIKPKFQALLRPCTSKLAQKGITANQVTLSAMIISVLLGALLYFASYPVLFLLIPVWFCIRMAFNAVDGMLAREFGQKSHLGAYLNELGDVISDTALYLPFLHLPFFSAPLLSAIIILSILSEFVGIMGPVIGAERRYDGPFGKSDRALAFSLVALIAVFVNPLPEWLFTLPILFIVLLLITIVNRIRAAIRQAAQIPENS
jgi:Phosphatidylglycerophosphate synthase